MCVTDLVLLSILIMATNAQISAIVAAAVEKALGDAAEIQAQAVNRQDPIAAPPPVLAAPSPVLVPDQVVEVVMTSEVGAIVSPPPAEWSRPSFSPPPPSNHIRRQE